MKNLLIGLSIASITTSIVSIGLCVHLNNREDYMPIKMAVPPTMTSEFNIDSLHSEIPNDNLK